MDYRPVGGSLIDVSDGLTLPWINGDLNSKPLQQTPVSENASETGYGGNGPPFDRFLDPSGMTALRIG